MNETLNKTFNGDGLAVEEYYREKFLFDNKELVSRATIINNINELVGLPDNSMNCIFSDGLLNENYDYLHVVEHFKRVLSPTGTAMCFATSIVPISSEKRLWGFTVASMYYIFGKYFNQEDIKVQHYGNVLAGRLLLSRVSVDSITSRKIDQPDLFFPVAIGIIVTKK